MLKFLNPVHRILSHRGSKETSQVLKFGTRVHHATTDKRWVSNVKSSQGQQQRELFNILRPGNFRYQKSWNKQTANRYQAFKMCGYFCSSLGHARRRRWPRRSDWSLYNSSTDIPRILKFSGETDHMTLDKYRVSKVNRSNVMVTWSCKVSLAKSS